MNYIKVQTGYNSYYVNLGNWTSDVPGWLSPNAHLLPEGLLLELPIYGSMLLIAMLGRHDAQGPNRWPTISVAGLIAVAFGTQILFDVVIEFLINIPSHAYGWSATVSWLTLFGNEVWRFPLYEGVFASFVYAPLQFCCSSSTIVGDRWSSRESNASGRLAKTERRPGTRGCRSAQPRFLGYTLPVTWIGLHADRHYTLPSYLSNGM